MNITKWNFTINCVTKSGNMILVEKNTLKRVLLPKKLVHQFFNSNTEYVVIEEDWKDSKMLVIHPKQIAYTF